MINTQNLKDINWYFNYIFLILLMIIILIMAFGLYFQIKFHSITTQLKFPDIATKADYVITVEPGGHVWLYDGGVYDIISKPKSKIRENNKKW